MANVEELIGINKHVLLITQPFDLYLLGLARDPDAVSPSDFITEAVDQLINYGQASEYIQEIIAAALKRRATGEQLARRTVRLDDHIDRKLVDFCSRSGLPISVIVEAALDVAIDEDTIMHMRTHLDQAEKIEVVPGYDC